LKLLKWLGILGSFLKYHFWGFKR